MTKKQILLVLCAFAALSLLAACGPTNGSWPNPAERHSFSLHIASEDRTQIHWEAHADRYRPGATETALRACPSREAGASAWPGWASLTCGSGIE